MAFFSHIFITYTKFVFSYAFYSIASWERVQRSHLQASIYANVLKTNKGFYIRIRFNSHMTGLHCLHCLQVAITAPERGPITHPAQEGWPHHRGLLPLLLSSEQWCGLFYVPQEPSGSAVRRDLRFTLLILGYTPEWCCFIVLGHRSVANMTTCQNAVFLTALTDQKSKSVAETISISVSKT